MNTVSASAATIVRQVVRQLLREIAAVPADGQPRAASSQLSDPRAYVRVSHRELSADDPLVANSPVVSPSSPRHHLYESFVVTLPSAEAERNGQQTNGQDQQVRDVLDETLYTMTNPVYSYPYGDSTGWLVTQPAYDMMLELLALRAEEEQDYVAKVFARSTWTGNNRGMHESMGLLVRQVTRHPSFATEDLIFRQPMNLLFLTHRGYFNAVRRYGISPDVQEAPARGFYAVDMQSYADCRSLLARVGGLIAVEFSYEGPCMRGVSPLNVPMYRIPEVIPLDAIRGVVDCSSGRDLWLGDAARDDA